MKKILLMFIFIFAFINSNAQEKYYFVEASDKASTQKIVIPDEVYNEQYTLEQNERAFYGEKIEINKYKDFSFDNYFFIRDELYTRYLTYNKKENKNLIITEKEISKPYIPKAFLFFLLSLSASLCFFIFSNNLAASNFQATNLSKPLILVIVSFIISLVWEFETVSCLTSVLLFKLPIIFVIVIVMFFDKKNKLSNYLFLCIIFLPSIALYFDKGTLLFVGTCIVGTFFGYLFYRIFRKMNLN